MEDGKIISSKVVDAGGSGHGALAGILSALKVDALICGGIGGGAQMALSDVGIRLYGGVSGNADAAAEALVAGKLDFNPNVRCVIITTTMGKVTLAVPTAAAITPATEIGD